MSFWPWPPAVPSLCSAGMTPTPNPGGKMLFSHPNSPPQPSKISKWNQAVGLVYFYTCVIHENPTVKLVLRGWRGGAGSRGHSNEWFKSWLHLFNLCCPPALHNSRATAPIVFYVYSTPWRCALVSACKIRIIITIRRVVIRMEQVNSFK